MGGEIAYIGVWGNAPIGDVTSSIGRNDLKRGYFMCTKGINIGEAELEIMKAIWRAEEPIGSAAIGEAVKDKGWKRTTIATFLAHLAEKGAIGAERRGTTRRF